MYYIVFCPSPVSTDSCRILFVYGSINTTKHFFTATIVFYVIIKRGITVDKETVVRAVDKVALRRWRKRGFYSESVLVKLLKKHGCHSVRIPVSNPSLSPLPDIIARKDADVYAFEVKNASYYAYFPKSQIDKLFRFLDELIPAEKEHKHAMIAAHLGKKWIFKEIAWDEWEKDKLPDKIRILKRDRGNRSFATL
jgi:Holliday junction resolvase